MPRAPGGNASPEFEHTLLINAAPTRVLAAFFDPHALAVWWQVARSVTTPRPMGVYAVEWPPTVEADDVLGRLGGVFSGRVMEYLPGSELFIADAWRLPVKQTGFDDTPRWRRYYAVIAGGWRSSLAALKNYVENPA